MTETEIKEKVKSYILSEFLSDCEPDELEDDTPLRSGGILDSIATIKLTTYLEEAFEITMEAHEMGDFDTLEEIVSLVAEKK
jgi:acyl carrier protein